SSCSISATAASVMATGVAARRRPINSNGGRQENRPDRAGPGDYGPATMPRPPLPTIPLDADESTTLSAFLDFYRAALLDRAHGLDDEQLRRTHAPTTLSLARLLGHLAFVEYTWFANRLDDEAMPEPWASLDWAADPDAEMTLAESMPGDELRAAYLAAGADAGRRTAAAESLDQLSARADGAGDRWTLRWILVHMIEEYARHCGHADLIRESIDGDQAP
ncbi:MAG: DinB family protein, partial [Actinomycetota bacterium]